MPMNYFADTVGYEEDGAIGLHLHRLSDVARSCGFESLFDAVLAHARLNPKDARGFAESGGLGKLYNYCCKIGRRPINEVIRKDLCQMSHDVYLNEWQTLLDNNSFKLPVSNFNEEHIEAFDFGDLFALMEHSAPNLVALADLVVSSRPSKQHADYTEKEAIQKDRKQKRRIVVAISVLANETNPRFNVLQNIVAYLLFANKVPKRIITILNHLGISASHSALEKALRSTAKSVLNELHKIASHREAFWVSFDNLTCAANVRDQRLVNQGNSSMSETKS